MYVNRIVSKTESREIRELVLRCLSQMIMARAVAIRSGWKSVYTVLTSSAYDNDEVRLWRLQLLTSSKY